MDLHILTNCPASPPSEADVKAQEQWLRDGTVPVTYVEAAVVPGFSTADAMIVIVSPIKGTETTGAQK